MRNLVASNPEMIIRKGQVKSYLVDFERTIENRSVEMLEPVMLVPRLIWLDSPNVGIVCMNVRICISYVGKRMVPKKMLMKPVMSCLARASIE